MKFNQLEIFINGHNEIVIRQIQQKLDVFIFITPDQADVVAEEIKQLAKQLKEEGENKINEK